jgi:hypothetical protein
LLANALLPAIELPVRSIDRRFAPGSYIDRETLEVRPETKSGSQNIRKLRWKGTDSNAE